MKPAALTSDRLHEIFEEQLCLNDEPDEKPDQFIEKVIEEYLAELAQSAHIPLPYLKSLREDLSVELQDMLRIKTYGFFNLADYRAHQLDSKNSSGRSSC